MLDEQVKQAFTSGIKKDWSNSILQLRKIKEIANHTFSPASEITEIYKTLDQEERDDIITSNLIYLSDEITETFTQKAPVFALEPALRQDLKTAQRTKKVSAKLRQALNQYGHKLTETTTVSIKPVEQDVQRLITSEGDIFYYRLIENRIFFKYDTYGSLFFKFHEPDFYEAIMLAVTPKYQRLIRGTFSDITNKIISLQEKDINRLVDTLFTQHSAEFDAIFEGLKQQKALHLDGMKQQMFGSLHKRIEQTYKHNETEISGIYAQLSTEERDFTVEHNWLLLQQEVNTLVTNFSLKSLENFFVFIHDPELFLGLLLAFDNKYRGILTGILKKIYCILFPPFYLDKDGKRIEMFTFSQKIYDDYIEWIENNKKAITNIE